LAIFQPAGLGGFDVYARKNNSSNLKNQIKSANIRSRIIKYTILISPIYFILTIIMSILLILSGDRPLVAVIHAMSTFSTSGISNVSGLQGSNSGIMGELLIALFLIFAISRFMYQQDSEGRGYRRLKRDKEVNIMLILIIIIPSLLFLRHWFGAIEASESFSLQSGLSAFWGGVFMVISFLSTTGFESEHWSASQLWSGLKTPGLILMGLCVLGGGIATTAGGVKLLRVYVLYKHGVREMTRLSYPHSVAGAGEKARSFRKEGAYAAWIFFMLFLVSLAVIVLGFSATGIKFEHSLILAISGLSTVGPLINVAGDGSLNYSQISDIAKFIFCIAMVLGRLEALAVIALFNPNYWSK
jgi:trk system potassium uptake protein TrkH